MRKIFSLIASAVLVTSTFYGDAQYQADRCDPCEKPKECPAPCPKPCPPKPCAAPSPKPCPPKPCCPQKPCPPPMTCDCLERGMELPFDLKCFPAAYNAPANILLKNCPWGVSLNADFIYWHVSQDGMYAARRSPVSGPVEFNGGLVDPNFKYKPGFKVGLGFNTDYDDWTVGLEYTWLHQSTSNSSTAVPAAPFNILNWGIGSSQINLLAISTKWKMHLDKLDLAFSRPYYQGQRLTVAPVGALRGLWIRQNYKIRGVTDAGRVDTYNTRSHSWAVGPMVGANTNWLMGCGFRFEGVASGAVLYTRYTKISQKQIVATTTHSSFHNLSVLRPMAELGVGLGWGTYIGCQDFYFDVSARYDFNVLWEQNVIAGFVNAMNNVPGTSGNLYMHGLTLNFRFDF